MARFFAKHKDFFSAPFKKKNEFLSWLENDTNNSVKFMILNCIFVALMNDFETRLEYEFAITGEFCFPVTPWLNSKEMNAVTEGDCFLLIQFFDKNPQVKDFLFKNLSHYEEAINAFNNWQLADQEQVAPIHDNRPNKPYNSSTLFTGTKRKELDAADRDSCKRTKQDGTEADHQACLSLS